MIIGILKEVKLNEYRVAMTPDGVHALVSLNHKVLVEKEAGVGADFSDEEYVVAGASIVEDAAQIYQESDFILHVRRPHSEEYNYIKENQIIMGYFHSTANEEQTKALIDLKAICIAYETVESDNGTFPLLAPMSEIAGRMAPLQGAKFLEKHFGGAGIFLGGVPGVEPAKVVVLGSGVVGINAAKMAAAVGADVYLLGLYSHQLRAIESELPKNVKTIVATPWSIKKYLTVADILIGAIYFSGAKSSTLVSRDDLKLMKAGSVLVDVAIDQGGCFETSRPTTHQDPVFVLDDIVHYCVPNMPGAYARTASISLSNATLPYIMEIATKGWLQAARDNSAIAKGLHLVNGQVIHPAISKTFGLELSPLEEVLKAEE